MLDSKNLETSMSQRAIDNKEREDTDKLNLGYLDLVYGGKIYQVGEYYVCIDSDDKKLKENGGGVSTNENLSGVDLYDKNAGLIGQYNTEDDIISYTFPDINARQKWLVMSLQRKQAAEDNYLIIINLDSRNDELGGNNGLVLRNSQKTIVLDDGLFWHYKHAYVSDFWEHAMGIRLRSIELVNRRWGPNWTTGRDMTDIIINRETLKILGIFKDGYQDQSSYGHITSVDNDHVRSCISFYNISNGIQAIEHKYDGSQISVKKFDTIYDLFDTYKPLLHVPGDKNEYDCNQIGYITDEKYFKFRGPLQSDNILHKSDEFLEIEGRSLYVQDRTLNLINIDGQKIDIETTGGKDQEEIVKAFGHEQTSSEQCITYIKQTLGDILTIVQNNTIIAGRLMGEHVTGDDLMLWQKFKIEHAFRNKVVNGTNLMYAWKFLEDSIQPLYKVYLCVEEYNSVQKQTSPVLLYNIHNGEAITDRDKINSLRKKFDGEIDRYSDRRGPDWKCLRETCRVIWDERCNYRKKFESRRELYRTGRWA